MCTQEKLDIIISIITKAWSKETCLPSLKHKWSQELPELGQCAVTSLLIQDYLGGKILHNKEFNHYYNKLSNGLIVDLTQKQFGNKYTTDIIETVDREKVISAENEKKALTFSRYNHLKKRFKEELRKQGLLLVEEKEHTDYKKTELWAILRDLEMGKIGVKYAYDKISRLI